MATIAGLSVLLDLEDRLSGKLDKSIGKIGKVGKSMRSIGKGMSLGVTAPILGAGAALLKIGSDADSMNDTIQIGTGATGKKLEGLQQTAVGVFKSIPVSMDDAGQAISDLYQRTGQTGKGLQDLATSELELSRITGQDLGEQIKSTTRLFGDWGVSVDKQVPTLDTLLKISQATGIGVDSLSDKMVRFGAPLRQMGFGFDEAAALLGKFEQAGVNTDLVMGSMRIALGKMAKEGITDPAVALKTLTDRIKNAGSAGEATAIAMEYFGAKAGPDMAASIREGKFEVDDLLKIVHGGKGSILDTADATDDWAEKLQVLKNRAIVAVLPLASQMFDAMNDGIPVFERMVDGLSKAVTWFTKLPVLMRKGIITFIGLLAVLGPVLLVLGSLIGAISTVAGLFTAGGVLAPLAALAGPILLVVAALAALAYAYHKNLFGFRDAVNGVAKAVWPAIKSIIGGFSALIQYVKAVVSDGDVLNDWLTHLPKPFRGVVIQIGRVINAFRKIGSAIGEIIQGFKTGGLQGGLDAIFGSAGKKLLAGIGDLVSAIPKAIGAVLQSIHTGFAPLDAIFTSVGKIFVDFGRLIQELFQGDWAGALAVGERLLGHFIDLVQAEFLLLPKIILAILSAIDWSFLWSKLQEASDALLGVLSGLSDSAFSLLSKAWDSIWDAVSGAFSRILNGFLELVDGIVEKLTGIPQTVVDTIKTAAGKVSGAVSDIVSNISGLPGKILTAMGDTLRTLYNAGANLIQGFINGIYSKLEALKDAIGDVMKAGLDKVSWIWQERSPSKVMEEKGENALLGWLRGWNNMLPAVQRAIGSFSPPAATPVTASATVPGAEAAAAGTGGQRQFTFHFAQGSIVVNDVSDAQEFADTLVDRLLTASAHVDAGQGI